MYVCIYIYIYIDRYEPQSPIAKPLNSKLIPNLKLTAVLHERVAVLNSLIQLLGKEGCHLCHGTLGSP